MHPKIWLSFEVVDDTVPGMQEGNMMAFHNTNTTLQKVLKLEIQKQDLIEDVEPKRSSRF